MPTILIADDNPLSLRFLADALAGAQVTCVCVADGAAAVREANSRPFDLLLLDARMPGLDGADALCAIRASNGPSRESPALATTADPDRGRRDELRAAGFLDVLPKPTSVAALRTAVAFCLNSQGPDAAGHSSQTQRGDSSNAPVEKDDALDDEQALCAVGGDQGILATLRELLMGELDALPTELADFQARNDDQALRDRLHRLDASAGFCGAPGLRTASARLRATLHDKQWPEAAAARFLEACATLRRKLARRHASDTKDDGS